MAHAGQCFSTQIKVTEDLRNAQYHAIALDDGALAVDGLEASGIIDDKPNTGDHAKVDYIGELKYAAGGAIGAGVRVTVAASGWIEAAASGDYSIGRNGETAITSGSLGTGFFDFTSPTIVTSN